jgi:hypothetical protein
MLRLQTNTLNVGMEWLKTVRVLQMDGCEFRSPFIYGRREVSLVTSANQASISAFFLASAAKRCNSSSPPSDR